eukprot:887942-Rhodomonas_salina.1
MQADEDQVHREHAYRVRGVRSVHGSARVVRRALITRAGQRTRPARRATRRRCGQRRSAAAQAAARTCTPGGSSPPSQRCSRGSPTRARR